MFDKLVVSTAQRRRGRTAKFFFARWSFIYQRSQSRLHSQSSWLRRNLQTPAQRFSSQHRPRRDLPSVVVDFVVDHGNSGGVPPRQDLNNLRRLEAIIGHTQTNPPRNCRSGGKRTSVQATEWQEETQTLRQLASGSIGGELTNN